MDREFLRRHPALVAHDLIGCRLSITKDGHRVSGIITECEAYAGPTDPASHASRLKVGLDVMGRNPGTVYTYLSYGLHRMMNIVAHEDGLNGGILIRAAHVDDGVELARHRRGLVPDERLAKGPGAFGQAFAVSLDDIGLDVFTEPFQLEQGSRPHSVWWSPRVGISKAVETPWRFFDPHSRTVSAHRRGTPCTPEDVLRSIPPHGELVS